MSKGTVIKRLPKLVEARKLATARAHFNGFMEAADLPRLAQAAQTIDAVEATLSFFINDENKRMLEGKVVAKVELECQRCLGGLLIELEAPVSLTMAWDDEQARALPKTSDPWIVGEGEEDLHFALEEELLLAMPVVSYHEHDCIDKSLLSSNDEIDAEPALKANPFSVLEQLKVKKPDA